MRMARNEKIGSICVGGTAIQRESLVLRSVGASGVKVDVG